MPHQRTAVLQYISIQYIYRALTNLVIVVYGTAQMSSFLMDSYIVTIIALAGITVAKRMERPLYSADTPSARKIPARVMAGRLVRNIGLELTSALVSPTAATVDVAVEVVEEEGHALTCCRVLSTSNGCVAIAETMPEVAPDRKVTEAGKATLIPGTILLLLLLLLLRCCVGMRCSRSE